MATEVLNKLEDVIAGFDEAAFIRTGARNESSLLAAKRKAAFNLYRKIPSPTGRDEEWRRTDPAVFPFKTLQRLPDLETVAPGAAGPWDDQFDAVVSISDTQVSIMNRPGSTQAQKMQVLTLGEAATRFPDLVADRLQGAALPRTPRKYELLNQAFWNVGLCIYVPAGTVLERGVLLRYHHKAAGHIVLPRLLIVVEERSEARVVEHFVSADGIPFMSVSSREFYVAANARLQLVSLQEWGTDTYHIGEDWARVNCDGRIDWITLTLGGRTGKMMVGCDVCEPNARAYLSGLFFAEQQQHFDQRTLQLHSAPDTYSNLLYKGAVKDQGYSVYQGIINAKPGAIRVDAYQMNNNLILNEGARADSLPGLEIDADDLKCSHGSTMGSLDREQLFYLRSRGLSEIEARHLIVAGFFEEVIGKVPYGFVQERLREQIRKKMGGG